jgi:transcriptional regulator with PAS, ATPase and Fis domain/tetratricopeptide (TPR) repeat protein
MVEPIQRAIELTNSGRFADALDVVERVVLPQAQRISADVLTVRLLERTGQHEASRALAVRLLRSKQLTAGQRSSCELALGQIDWESNDTAAAVAHLQRAMALSADAHDPQQSSWTQLWLWLFLAEQSGTDAASSTLEALRSNAASHPDPQILAAIHIFVAINEGKRGFLHSAERHNRIGRELILKAPNKWLEAVSENNELAFSVLRSDFDGGLLHARRALELADQSGVAVLKRASLGNLGNLYYFMGRLDDATDSLNQACGVMPQFGPNGVGVIDALANIHLLNDQPSECERLLDELDSRMLQTGRRESYVYRHSQLTRTKLLAYQGKLQDAISSAEHVLTMARDIGDHALQVSAQLALGDLFQRTGHFQRVTAILDSLSSTLGVHPPDVYAQYEQIIGCALARVKNVEGARHHLERSRRIYETVGAVTGIIDLERRTREARGCGDAVAGSYFDQTSHQPARAVDLLHSVAGLMLHGNRPDLLASEVAEILRKTGVVEDAVASRRRIEDLSVPAAQHQHAEVRRSSADTECLPMGSMDGGSYEVNVCFKRDIESVATINAVKLLVHTIHDLERARLEREERATLWPIDELPLDNGQAVAVGEMHKLLALARRIASTNVSVLITGESGTGKEILARAVHAFSARAAKPFVAMNCTAIPRDLLESQMFGHRRGAFTGADRDHLGVIRAARDGTLFLDEIGEMGLDLQPKILRFLESGEISPLGDPEPVNVNVRIVAATNTNLEDLVRDGRFREDLFYRLNVFRLSIPPLRKRRDEIPSLVNEFVRRAALEFHKGHVRVSEETMEHLLVYSWPGNIRQLQNELRRIVALAEPNSIVAPGDIAAEIRAALPIFPSSADGRHIAVSLNERLMPTLNRIEGEMIKIALRDHGGKVDAAARALGISRKGLYLKRQRLGL